MEEIRILLPILPYSSYFELSKEYLTNILNILEGKESYGAMKRKLEPTWTCVKCSTVKKFTEAGWKCNTCNENYCFVCVPAISSSASCKPLILFIIIKLN